MIIIINYHSIPGIINCLQKLFGEISHLSKKLAYQFKIIVVDNNSPDNSVLQIQRQFPEFKYIINKSNLGFSKANNKGIKWALKHNFDLIMLINPDVVGKTNFLEPLIQLIKQVDNYGLVAPLIIEKKNNKSVYVLGAKLNSWLGRISHQKVLIKPKKPIIQDFVSGCCLLIKKEVFQQIGLLDERFFMYFEDSDFGLRARQADFKLLIEPKAQIYHQTSSSIGQDSWKKIYYNLVSNLKFDLKHIEPWFWPLCIGYLVIIGIKMIINRILKE